jgi:hypothetical protein
MKTIERMKTVNQGNSAFEVGHTLRVDYKTRGIVEGDIAGIRRIFEHSSDDMLRKFILGLIDGEPTN